MDNENHRVCDMEQKISMIKTIVKKCNKFVTNNLTFNCSLSGTIFITNVSKDTIQEAVDKSKVIGMKQLLERQEELKANIIEANILSCQIHAILYKYYVIKRKVPDLKTITKELAKSDINDFYKVLHDRGFIWRHDILIEDPVVQAKRIKYLLDMKRFREENRIFIFAEEKELPHDNETLKMFEKGKHYLETGYGSVKIAVSPQLGVISLSVNNQGETTSDWLIKEVAQHMKPSFVLVIDESMIKEEPIEVPPTSEARKAEMIQWLERKNIPFNNTMHRADLYELIELYKDKWDDKKYVTVELLKSKGVEIVKRPKKGWPDLNYFEPFWLMEVLWHSVPTGNSVCNTIGNRIEMAVNVCSLTTWEFYAKTLSTKESELFQQDMELEEVIDKLLLYTKEADMRHKFRLPKVTVTDCADDKVMSKFSGTL
ncbi:uncharacterized protein LOC128680266 [Plodia interpunctella]|uniref:uncharacterized protein LOC128680266 n=1 Tax=Plodia interpunctella TaxID=58824 RepID=UPI00236767DF|nr:uncharacterized protein LOC128680266 [Plodia interpunctella]